MIMIIINRKTYQFSMCANQNVPFKLFKQYTIYKYYLQNRQ